MNTKPQAPANNESARASLGRWERGEITLAQLFSIEQADLRGVAALAAHYYDEEQHAAAITVFEGLQAIGFDLGDYLPLLASSYQMEKRNDEAITTYVEALRRKPNDLYMMTNLGELLLGRGRFNDAAALFARVIELDPKQAHPAGARARALVVKGDRAAKGK